MGIAAAMRIVMPLMNGASWHDKHKGRRIMSTHESYISKDGAFHFIHRQKGGRYEVLRYRRLEYTDQNVSFLCDAITDHLTPDLISQPAYTS